MTRLRNKDQPWRVLWLIPIALAAALSIVATGGGGGGDGGVVVDDDNDVTVTILPNYNFFLANLAGDQLLTASVGNLFTASLDIDGLFPGNLDLNTDANNNVTFVSYRIRQTARVDVTVTPIMPTALEGTFTVIVNEDIGVLFGGEPDSGAFDVITPAETVTVSIQSTSIALALNGGTPVVYNTWEAVSDLVDDESQETWQRRAALGASALEFMVGQFFTVADVLDALERVTMNNPVVEACDMFPGAPPAGVLGQGEVSITWLGSGELSEGDDFDWSFNQCWSSDAEEVLDGTITLADYTETVDSNTNTLFEIGFGGLSGQPGGVVYNFTASETQEDLGIFTIAPEDIVTVTGGFALIIQSP